LIQRSKAELASEGNERMAANQQKINVKEENNDRNERGQQEKLGVDKRKKNTPLFIP